MQFLLSTFNSVGPDDASSLTDIARRPPRDQLYRAWLVWKRDGHSWREWGTAGICGLR